MSATRVLVVEDNEALADNLSEILVDHGYEVKSAATMAEATALAPGFVDVALIDLKLPDGDGTTLAAALKRDRPECEVVLLTGHASVESAAAAVHAGAWAYLLKPCAPPDLLRTLEQAVRHQRAQRDRVEAERRAQVAEKLAAVGTLTAGLSHEIRNPLNAALLQLTVLERRVAKLPEPNRGGLLEPLTLVRDEIRRLDHVLEDFLQFARPHAFTPRRLVLREVVNKVTDLLAPEAATRGLRLELRCPDALAVNGDEGRLRQVLMNLCLNALDASPRGGTVDVECVREGDWVTVNVDDRGPGVPAELKPRIFEPFFTTKSQGSGLGLPITNAIVTQHGGSVTVADRPGGGGRFSVRLPLAH